MTAKEIMNLEEGTLVKIKHNVDCHKMWKSVGKLTFGNPKPDKGEYKFGILVGDNVCYEFSANKYKLYIA